MDNLLTFLFLVMAGCGTVVIGIILYNLHLQSNHREEE